MKRIIYALLLIALYIACSDNDKTQLQKPDVSFSTFVDERDGNEYRCITIGDQTWMAENLRYRIPQGPFYGCYSYGETVVPESKVIVDQELWVAALDAAIEGGRITGTYMTYVDLYKDYYTASALIAVFVSAGEGWEELVDILNEIYKECIPEAMIISAEGTLALAEIDNNSYSEHYGMLYSYKAALDAVPDGWRLPTDKDWQKLEETLGIPLSELDLLDEWRGEFEGELLKSGEDGIGFDAVYGGTRAFGTFLYGSPYMNKGSKAYYWSSTQYVMQDSIDMGIIRVVSYFDSQIMRGSTREGAAYNVRCIKE